MCNDNIRNYNSRNSRIRWFGLSYTYTELVNYISHKNYPVDFSKKQKRRLREKAQSFYVSNQSLFHKGVKGNVTVTVVGEVFVDILRRTCFLYLSYIKGNGRCRHFATSFVLLNW